MGQALVFLSSKRAEPGRGTPTARPRIRCSKVAGINRLNLQGNAEQQVQDLRAAMQSLFPEAVILVREAREGFGT